jgi:hypothetical protein
MTRHLKIYNKKYRVENFGQTYKFFILDESSYVYESTFVASSFKNALAAKEHYDMYNEDEDEEETMND